MGTRGCVATEKPAIEIRVARWIQCLAYFAAVHYLHGFLDISGRHKSKHDRDVGNCLTLGVEDFNDAYIEYKPASVRTSGVKPSRIPRALRAGTST